jgi:hypothetical protein
MAWIREVVFDVLITLALISIFLFNKVEWIVAFQIYTPILIFLKLLALMGSNVRERLTGDAPASFFHTLYSMNVLVLVMNAWWALAVQWMLVWFISWVFHNKVQRKLKKAPVRHAPRVATTTKLAHRKYF